MNISTSIIHLVTQAIATDQTEFSIKTGEIKIGDFNYLYSDLFPDKTLNDLWLEIQNWTSWKNYSLSYQKPDERSLSFTSDLFNGDIAVERDDEQIRFKPTKSYKNYLEKIIGTNNQNIGDIIRTIALQPNFKIEIRCVGAKRAEQIAKTILYEQNSIKNRCHLIDPKVDSYIYRYHHDTKLSTQLIPALQDHIHVIRNEETYGRSVINDDVQASRKIVITPLRSAARSFAKRSSLDLKDNSFPKVFISILSKDGELVVEKFLNQSAEKILINNVPPKGFWNDEINKINKIREQRKPRGPKTWHATKELVAKAYVDRIATKGFVSGKSLFFIGPVAYSLYRNNPIYAFVKGQDGEQYILENTDLGLGGTKLGTVSSSMGDIRQLINQDEVTIIRAYDIFKYIRYLGNDLERLFWSQKSLSDEELRQEVTIDAHSLMTYINAIRQKLDTEISVSEETRFATQRQLSALKGVVDLQTFLGHLDNIFGTQCQDLRELNEYTILSDEKKRQLSERQEQIRTRAQIKMSDGIFNK